MDYLNMNAKSNTNDLIFDDLLVFKYINPDSNDKLSDISGLDLQDLIFLINHSSLKLREKLGLEQDITFGLEIEFEKAKKDIIESKIYDYFNDNSWSMFNDNSLIKGAEIVSPILKDNEQTWKDTKKVCSIIESYASIDRNSGGHIHVGTQVLGDKKESWLNFIKLWSVYENIIYRFCYGEFLTARPSTPEYAEPVSQLFWGTYVRFEGKNASITDILYRLHERYQAVNFGNVSIGQLSDFMKDNTIEFRCPNGTLNPVVWQNNVNLFVNLLKYSKDSSFDDDIVQKRHLINLDKFLELKWYNEIYLEQALELCDMIFSSNIDKIYFLKQYLKSFQVSKNKEDYLKTKRMIMKK